MFYHRTAVEAAETYLLEVIDYCYRKLAKLVSKYLTKFPKFHKSTSETNREENCWLLFEEIEAGRDGWIDRKC